MSSMGRAAFLVPVLLATSASASAQTPSWVLAQAPAIILTQAAAAAAAVTDNIGNSINDWRRLRQGGNYSFTDYARFLNYNEGWPAEAALRRNAERAMRPGENAATILAFYRTEKPVSGNGWARYADALNSSGRPAEAIAAAREAWASADLNAANANDLLARFGGYLTAQDHNRRVDALLFDKNARDAAALLAWTSADRRPAFAARIAMHSRAPDTEVRFRAAAHRISADAGLLMDRLRYLRDGGNEYAARSLAAQPHNFTERPADPDRWYEMLLILAGGAAGDRQYTHAYNIARQLDDAFPPGTDITKQSYGVRDKYTSLAWLAGRTALDRLNNPANAVVMFDRYARGGQSLQVASKGHYWAGRAALAARQPAQANNYWQRAAMYPELFYSQLALERLGRAVPTPGSVTPVAQTTRPGPRSRRTGWCARHAR
jgi:soluble lytic murein transglycosylase